MEVIVHGTKGGYHIYYQTPNIPISIARDVRRPDGNLGNPIGQFAYSIAFADNGCAFTKYVFVRDTHRKADGNMAFSLYITNQKKLSGKHIKDFLDNIAAEYTDKYVVNGNLDIVHEDWTFLEKGISDYKEYLKDVPKEDREVIVQGKEEAAFIYYSSEDELCKYFDDPYEEEYSLFRHMFFVKKYLKEDLNNPLNALKHDSSKDLTGKIDLENPKYRLIFNESANKGVKIGANVNIGGHLTKRRNNEKIRLKDELQITYQKPYYDTVEIKDLCEKIDSKFIDVNHQDKTVTIKEVKLLPIEKTIEFEFNKQIDNIKITIKNSSGYQPEKRVEDRQIVFKGEELRESWVVSAQKDNFIAKQQTFIPENSEDIIQLILEEHKLIEIRATSEGGEFSINIRIDILSNIQSNGNKLNFIGDEIDKEITIIVSDHKRKYDSKSFTFTPRNIEGNIHYVALNAVKSSGDGGQKKQYNVDPGDHGRLKDGNQYYSKRDDGKDISNDCIIPNKGYEFIGFELTGSKIIAQYQKKKPFYKKMVLMKGSHFFKKTLIPTKVSFSKKTWYIPASIAVIIIVAIALFFDLPKINSKNDEQSNKNKIFQYCEGIDLNIDTLINYQTEYSRKDSIHNQNEEWYEKIVSFFISNDGATKTSTEKTDYLQKIDSALILRRAINTGKIDLLKGMLYSDNQREFENSINNIKDEFKQKISEVMLADSISTIDLNTAAKYISNFHKLLEMQVGLKTSTDTTNLDSKKGEIEGVIFPITSSKIDSVKQEILKEISEIIKINTHTKRKNDSRNGSSSISNNQSQEIGEKSPLKNRILKTDFYELIHKGNNQKDSYNELYKKHKDKSYENGSEEKDILLFLRKICENSQAFGKFKNKINSIDAISLLSINSLSDIDIK